MLYEISGICMHCAETYNLLVNSGEIVGCCSSCNNDPFEMSKVEGVVYVIKNDNQLGVKIGITTKSVEQRIRQLSSTGVPGSFYPIAIFPTATPRKHEKMAHEKMVKFKLEKEHFNLEPVDAVLKVYRALNKRIEPIFYIEDIQETFKLRLEKDRIEMELKLKGKRLK